MDSPSACVWWSQALLVPILMFPWLDSVADGRPTDVPGHVDGARGLRERSWRVVHNGLTAESALESAPRPAQHWPLEVMLFAA